MKGLPSLYSFMRERGTLQMFTGGYRVCTGIFGYRVLLQGKPLIKAENPSNTQFSFRFNKESLLHIQLQGSRDRQAFPEYRDFTGKPVYFTGKPCTL